MEQKVTELLNTTPYYCVSEPGVQDVLALHFHPFPHKETIIVVDANTKAALCTTTNYYRPVLLLMVHLIHRPSFPTTPLVRGIESPFNIFR